MINDVEKIIANEAIRIGDQILESSQLNKNGINWPNVFIDNEGKVQKINSYSLYDGAAGTSLFLVELYKFTNNSKYIDAAKMGLNWAIEECLNEKDVDNLSFYTGVSGVSYVAFLLSDILKLKEYGQIALQIVEKKQFDLLNTSTQDLFSGAPGNLLGLLHIYSKTQNAEILKLIKKNFITIVDAAIINTEGLSWNRTGGEISNLCGFAHGASGIGFALLEMGYYFNDKTCIHIAKQAFQYENKHFNKKLNNWPDYRKKIYGINEYELHKRMFRNNNNFFYETNDFVAWCHGAMGIGLTRLRAYSLTKNNKYLKEYFIAIKKIEENYLIKNGSTSWTLCHGLLGNATLLIEGYKYFNDINYLNKAIKLAESAIHSRNTLQKYYSGFGNSSPENMSLFMGNSGIGMFYLQILNPNNISSVLYPILKKKSNKLEINNRVNKNELLQKILNKDFFRTNVIISKLGHSITTDSLSLSKSNIILLYLKLVDEIILSTELKFRACIEEIFTLEKSKFYIRNSKESRALQYIDEMERQLVAKKFLDTASFTFQNTLFILSSRATIINTKWNWDIKLNKELYVDNLNIIHNEENYCVVFVSTYHDVNEVNLNSFSKLIINQFTFNNSVNKIKKDIYNSFKGKFSKSQINPIIESQISQFIAFGVIVPVY